MLLWLKAIRLPYENPEHPLYCPPGGKKDEDGTDYGDFEFDNPRTDKSMREIFGDEFVDRMNNL